MRNQVKRIIFATVIVLLNVIVLYQAGCYPDRLPTNADYQVPDVRRPGIAHNVPIDESEDVRINTPITIWFDELIEPSSVTNNFFVWPIATIKSITLIAIDPQNSSMVYAVKPGDGIYKSEDAGESWYWLTPGYLKLNITDLLVSQYDQHLLYLTSSDGGVLKSTDAGVSWQEINQGLPTTNVLALDLAANDNNLVYITTAAHGVFRSDDGGQTWVERNNGLRVSRTPFDIEINPFLSRTLYIASNGDFILKSIDGGDSWTRLSTGMTTRNFKQVIVHPQDTSLVFALSEGGGIYRSKNAGKEWQLTIQGLTNLNIRSLAVNRQDVNQLILCTSSGIFTSTNQGDSWIAAGQIPGESNLSMIEIPVLDPTRVFTAAVSGVYRSDDQGKSWVHKINLPLEALYLTGTIQLEQWRDSTVVISPIDSVQMDTTAIHPYVYDRALTAWIAGGKTGPPPVDDNPSATKLIFTPEKPLIPNLSYQVRIKGKFEGDKQSIQNGTAVADLDGNSLETNKNFTFTTGQN